MAARAEATESRVEIGRESNGGGTRSKFSRSSQAFMGDVTYYIHIPSPPETPKPGSPFPKSRLLGTTGLGSTLLKLIDRPRLGTNP